jgi:hypothetical protein
MSRIVNVIGFCASDRRLGSDRSTYTSVLPSVESAKRTRAVVSRAHMRIGRS